MKSQKNIKTKLIIDQFAKEESKPNTQRKNSKCSKRANNHR
jgi:hypothetical protein